jgi:chemotaxis protein methyltransferase CheR
MIQSGNDGEGDVRSDPFSGREFPFTYRDFSQIADIVQKDAGIALSDVKAPLVYSRLVRRLRTLGMESFHQYCALVARNEEGEREEMIAALTTNVTRFFRENHHFEHFRNRVLPDLIPKARKGAPLRFWSAGCSSGEEPYSLALSILALLPEATNFDIRILATDINRNVLEAAKTGLYSAAALAPLEPELRDRFFLPSGHEGSTTLWRAGPELRAMVAFRELNLIADWPMRQRYQAIFCRNVAIYFESSIRAAFWDRFASLLAPNGVLYIGHSERITTSKHRFKAEGNTTYRLVQAG